MIGLLPLLALLAAPPPQQQQIAAPPAQQKLIAASAEHVFFGRISEQAPLTCEGELGSSKEVWGTPYLEGGFVRLVDLDPRKARVDGLVGRAAVIYGAPLGGPAGNHPYPCFPLQMRNDWVYGKDGMRVQRTTPPYPAFRATRAVALGADLSARLIEDAAGDRVEVRFRNPLDRPLKWVIITAHHDGCYAKPGSTAESVSLPELKPGAVFTARLPARVSRKQGRGVWHAAAALTVTADGERVGFDLDVPLSELGVTVDCPAR